MQNVITQCRICKNTNLVQVLDLGVQALTGYFSRSVDEYVSTGPLELVIFAENTQGDYCGLIQLRHSFDPVKLYGNRYGYRSSLNMVMVNHLNRIVEKLEERIP